MNTETEKQTSFQKPDSLDAIFSDSFKKKEKALELIARGGLSEDELTLVARAVYETTFSRIFDMDYSQQSVRTNGEGRHGCAIEVTELRQEAASYFNCRSGNHYDSIRLTHPAVWFALKNFWRSDYGIYEMVGLPKNPTVQEINKKFEMFKSEFKEHLDYLKANIQNIFSNNRG